MPSLPDRPPLTPAQQHTQAVLGTGATGGRPTFPADLADRLESELAAGLAPIVTGLPDDVETLWISKYSLGAVHGCEASFLATTDEPFAWTIPIAVGKVAHKAVEMSVAWRGELVPLDLVDEAFASLVQDSTTLGEWLQTLGDGDAAQLRALANSRVAAFLDTFPPLDRRWKPVTESPARVELFEGRIILSGKVDLTLGFAGADGSSGKVLIDLKTGGGSAGHVEDLRFYALLETIRLRTPPRLCATYYLDSGRPHPEAVTEALLEGALARTIDGAIRMVELLHHDHPPVKRPGPPCRWCRLAPDCREGQAWLAGEDDT